MKRPPGQPAWELEPRITASAIASTGSRCAGIQSTPMSVRAGSHAGSANGLMYWSCAWENGLAGSGLSTAELSAEAVAANDANASAAASSVDILPDPNAPTPHYAHAP